MEQPHDAMLAVLHWLDNVDVLTGSGAGQVCVPGAGTYPMKQLIHNVFSLACVKKAFPRCYRLNQQKVVSEAALCGVAASRTSPCWGRGVTKPPDLDVDAFFLIHFGNHMS